MSETSPDAEEGQFSLLVEEKYNLHFIKHSDAEIVFCDAEEPGTSQVPSAPVGKEGTFTQT